ncbi:PQQ-binding-like beta-propeller repeat protein [Candidatus Latescibacterota bacterium]
MKKIGYIKAVILTCLIFFVSGSVVWSAEGDILWKFNAESCVNSSPAVDINGTIYFASDNGVLFAVNSDGVLKWKYETGTPLHLAGINFGHVSPSIGPDGRIYIGLFDGYFYAINNDGTLRWKYRIENPPTNSDTSSSPAIDGNGNIYIGTVHNGLYCITPEGTLQWQYAGVSISCAPAIDRDGNIYFGSREGNICAIDSNGVLKWKYKTDDIIGYSSPALDNDGNIYIGSLDYHLYALTPSGTLLWKYAAQDRINCSPVIDKNGFIYFVDETGEERFPVSNHIYALNPDGTLYWKKLLGHQVFGSSLLVDDEGTIIVPYHNPGLDALNPDGSLKWRSAEGPDVFNSSPALSDGVLYVGSSWEEGVQTNKGCLYAIDTGTNAGLANSPWPKFQRDLRNTGAIPSSSNESDYGTQITFSGNRKQWKTDWSPDGNWLAYSEMGDDGLYKIWIVPSSGGESVNLTGPIAGYHSKPNFTINEKEVIFSNQGIDPVDENDYKIQNININTKEYYDVIGNAQNGCWSHDGRFFAYRTAPGMDLYVWDTEKDNHQFLVAEEDIGYPVQTFSHDDSHIITQKKANGEVKLFQIPVKGGQIEQLTSIEGDHWYPDMSSSGNWILYTEFQQKELWAYNTISGVSSEIFPGSPYKVQGASFSPDGSKISYFRENTIGSGIYEVFFADFPFGMLNVLSPNSGENWKVGSQHNIIWNQNDIQDIIIEFSVDGGANWTEISTGIEASLGIYQWTIPDNVSSEGKIRIRGVSQKDISAESGGLFTIFSDKFVNVISPTNGDLLYGNSKYEIQWEYNGITDMNIHYSTDNGVSWKEAVSGISASTGSYLWAVPDEIAMECKIKITDAGDSSISNISPGLFEIARQIILIEHEPITVAQENTQIVFICNITSDAAIDNVLLYFDTTGRREFNNIFSFIEESEGNFKATLPIGVFTAKGIEYYIAAEDTNKKQARKPEGQRIYSINAQVTEVTSSEVVSGGPVQNAYRMVSVPLYLNQTLIFDQLQGIMPNGENGTDWRLFQYSPGSTVPQEYPDIDGFSPGKAFWLITKEDYQLKTSDGTSVTTSEPFNITLSSGWNDIANPWMFDISWKDIDNPSNANLDVLYSYEGSWSDPTNPSLILEPWKGYSVRNLENINVIIKLNPIPAQDESTTVAKPSIENNTEMWKLKIKATANNAMDTANYLGVSKDAKVEWDRYDHVEPPPIGDYVSVSFPHEDWEKYPYVYTVDFRPPGDTITWDFNVKTNIPQETVVVQLSDIDDIPDEYHVRIYDLDMGSLLDAENSSFSFASGNSLTERHFRIVISTSDEPGSEELQSKPGAFITARNYPNPFNPQTTIQYELAGEGNVTVSVFNSVGQEILSHDAGQKEPGIYNYVFDASNFTTGIYFYRIDVGDKYATGKMLYMK